MNARRKKRWHRILSRTATNWLIVGACKGAFFGFAAGVCAVRLGWIDY